MYNMLKKLSFSVAVLGIGLLLFLLGAPAEEFSGSFEEHEENKKIFLEGKVDSERDFREYKSFTIDGVEVICDCREELLGKRIRVEGIVEEYEGKRQIRVLEIGVLEKNK